MTEFLQKGYWEASLRNIVKTAGITIGAFYGYYNSKEELFSALVDESYRYIMNKYREYLAAFAKLPPCGFGACKCGNNYRTGGCPCGYAVCFDGGVACKAGGVFRKYASGKIYG